MTTPQKLRDLEDGVNQGVIAPSTEETMAEGILDISQFPIVAEDSDLDKFLSDLDAQSGKFFDTLGCNIFSSIGMSEVYLNALGGDIDYLGDSGRAEFSERKACVDAGLDGTRGSSEQQWENALATHGLVKHNDWQWLPDMTREQFFAPTNPTIDAQGLKFIGKYTPFHRALGTDLATIKEALKYGAVKIFVGTGPGWNQGEPNVVPKTTNPMGHAIMVRKIDALGIHIRDHYVPFLKVLAPNYIIYYAYQTLFKKVLPFKHTFTFDLQYGMTSPECINLQMALLQDGEFPVTVPYNQNFGRNTLKAVQKFQTRYGIASPGMPGYGRCGPKTRIQLNLLFS